MVKRGTVVLLVVVLATFVGLTVPREAEAFHESSPFQSLRAQGTSSSFFNSFKQLLRGSGTPSTQYGTLIGGESSTTAKGLETMTMRARMGSRFLPVLGTVASRVTLYGTAAYVGWKIYQHFSDGGEVEVDLWLDANSLGKDALLNPAGIPTDLGDSNPKASFYWAGAGLVKQSGSNCAAVGTAECFVVELAPAYCGGGAPAPNGDGACNSFYSNRYLSGMGGGIGSTGTNYPYYWMTPTFPPTGPVMSWGTGLDWDYCRANGIDWNGTCFQDNSGSATIATITGYMVWRTFQNLTDGRTIGGAASTPVTSSVTVGAHTITTKRVLIPATTFGMGATTTTPPGGSPSPQLETDYTVPSNAGETSTDLDNALDAYDSPCGIALINHLLSPLLYPWVAGCIELDPDAPPEHVTGTLAPKVLPKPLPGETATAYRTRLRTAGFLGTITIDELADEDLPTEYLWQPSEVVRIHIGTPSTTIQITDPWPTPAPVASPTTDVTIEAAPETPTEPRTDADPLPPGYGGGATSDCEPWLEADPDFSPLTGLDLDGKFPFALFAWVGGVLGSLSAVADAPSWDFHIVIPATAVSSETDLGHFEVDLEWADSYMSTVRTILTFVLWIGAVWFFATSLLGLRAPGNPAEAVDEA